MSWWTIKIGLVYQQETPSSIFKICARVFHLHINIHMHTYTIVVIEREGLVLWIAVGALLFDLTNCFNAF